MVDMERHARHLVLPQVGIEGQEKLAKAKVFVVGAGGLGSPVLLYLAAAGIGTNHTKPINSSTLETRQAGGTANQDV